MFKGRKIKKLLEQYAEAGTNGDDSKIISELKQLGKPALQDVIEAFQRRALDPDKAQYLLEKITDDSNMDDILPLIGGSNSELRRVAKEMVHNRWKTASIPLLIDYIESSDLYLRTNAVDLLTRFKVSSCVPTLVSKFNGAAPDFKNNILKILTVMDDQSAKKLMLSALNDDEWQVRLEAVKSIGKMQDPGCIDPLIEMLEEKDHKLRGVVVDALGAIGNKRAAPSLVNLLKDEDMIIRQKTAEYLIEIADATIVPDIIDLMRDKDVNVRRSAVEVLNNLKDPRTSVALMEAIKDSDWWVRQIATESLTKLKGDNIVKGFIAMIKDEDESMRRCAVEFFNEVPNKLAYEPLLELLSDEDWWVREKAITALGRLKDKRAIVPLLGMIDDGEVSAAVPGALADIGGPEGIQQLKELLFNDSKRFRIETIKALGRLKAEDAVPDLKECLTDPDQDIRNEAVDCLKGITGKVFKVTTKSKPDQEPNMSAKKGGFPEGTLLTEAILVLDLCNSTDIAARYGDHITLKLMQILTDTIKPIAQQEKVQLMKNTGDGFLITFPKVDNSVRFAWQTLDKIGRYNKKVDDISRINLRFAINLGETKVVGDGDRMGVAINMAFRVEGLNPDNSIPIDNAIPKEEVPLENRIFVTESVEKEVENMKGFNTRMVGLFELKGITGLHKIYHLSMS